MAQFITPQNALKHICEKEQELDCFESLSITNAFKMIKYLQLVLKTLKSIVIQKGFSSPTLEIEFFKTIKPEVLGKLIFYNKVYRYESNCPSSQYSNQKYYSKKIEELYLEYKQHLQHSEFFKYYKTNRTDRDLEYFTLGNINTLSGINSFVFEIDLEFSTYYDYKVARIISHNLLVAFLNQKINFEVSPNSILSSQQTLIWSESQNALIELIYALYVSGSINNGKLEIRKIAVLFQELFDVKLLDIHHAFHRMKTRAKSKTSYLDKLKNVLEEYMDKD